MIFFFCHTLYAGILVTPSALGGPMMSPVIVNCVQLESAWRPQCPKGKYLDLSSMTGTQTLSSDFQI